MFFNSFNKSFLVSLIGFLIDWPETPRLTIALLIVLSSMIFAREHLHPDQPIVFLIFFVEKFGSNLLMLKTA